MNSLALQDVGFERDDRFLFQNLSLVVAPGKLLHITGPNGSGKSTVIRLIAGLLEGFNGQITVNGESSSESRRHLCFLWTAQPSLKPTLTARQNLAWLLALSGDTGDVDPLLKRVGLLGWDDVPVAQLSTGQGRRVLLAQAMAASKPLWLLDEPFNALDAAGQAQLAALVREKMSQGISVVLASHHDIAGLTPDQRLELGP